MKRIGRLVGAGVLGCLLAVVATLGSPAATATTPVPVLGSAHHLAPIGSGWGTVRPESIFNGGDPAGSAFHLTWRDWGQRVTFGRGLTWIFRPDSGYYGRPAGIVLRAQDLGRCADGTVGYRNLWYRVAHRPRARLERHWHRWTGRAGDLCSRY